jgi:hypothetical protein
VIAALPESPAVGVAGAQEPNRGFGPVLWHRYPGRPFGHADGRLGIR